MRGTVATLTAALILVGSPLHAAPTIKGETKYKPHQLVRLAVDGVDSKAGIRWRVYPSLGVQKATTPRGVLEFAAPPGTYEVEALFITAAPDGSIQIDEAATTVVIESCHPPEPPKPMPPGPKPNPPGAGKLDPSNAIARIQFGNAGCSATVIGPRRTDGKWEVLTAAHCIGSVGQTGTLRMPLTGKVHRATVVRYDRTCDVAWLITDEVIDDIEYAFLASGNPPVGTPVWHQGYGFDRPRNREDGVVTGAEGAGGQLRFTLNVSSGDSGGGIFRADTNEVISTVCCTQSIAAKTSMWGGSTAQAWRLKPTPKGAEMEGASSPAAAPSEASKLPPATQDDWTPLTIPTRNEPSASTEPRQDEWTPVTIPIKQDETATAPASAPAPCIVTRPQTLVGWPGQQSPVIYPQQGWRVYP